VTAHGPSKRILVLEDNDSLRWMLEQFFSSFPETTVKTCSTAERAEEVLDAGYVPNIAIVDYHLGDARTSSAFCRRLNVDVPDCILFLTSGMVDETVASASGRIRYAGFLEKPFSFEDLDHRLNKLLEGSEARTFGFTRYPQASDDQITQLRELVGQRPGDVKMKRMLAFSLYLGAHYPEAGALYDELLPLSDDFYVAYYGGHTWARLNCFERAVDFWNRALALASSPSLADKVRRRLECARQMMTES